MENPATSAAIHGKSLLNSMTAMLHWFVASIRLKNTASRNVPPANAAKSGRFQKNASEAKRLPLQNL